MGFYVIAKHDVQIWWVFYIVKDCEGLQEGNWDVHGM